MKSPHHIFLIDGIGALVSAIMLGIVLVYFEGYIGMPLKVLYPLAAMALSFCIYSFSIYRTKPTKWQVFLRVIAIANLFYMLISGAFLVIYFNSLTLLGVLYFIGEKVVVGVLAFYELQWARKRPNTVNNSE